MSSSVDKLMAAFAGESQANRKYLAFAKKADQEGQKQVARLFRAAAEAETVHALNPLTRAGKIAGTEANLGTAIEGETYEYKQMYPEFMGVAKADKNSEAQWSFNVANKVEEIHAGLYKKALDAVKAGKQLPAVDYYVCQTCGNTVEGSPPGVCPICGMPGSQFKLIA